MSLYLIQEENETASVEHVMAFDLPKGPWRIQRPDGQYYKGYESASAGDVFVADAARACAFHTERSAQNIIDISCSSQAGRARFKGCKPVHLAPLLEPGDHVVCGCGMTHEASYCPTADGHGAAL